MSELAVFEYLCSLPKNETIYYRANPGNAGDALIASGAYQLFDSADLKIELIDPDSFSAKDKIILYAGGGNLVGIYPEARDFFLRYHTDAKQLILLPHTVAGNEDLLSELRSNVTLFARERVSYEHLKSSAKNAHVFLDHDLALNLDANKIINSPLMSFPEAVIKKLAHKARSSEKSTSAPQPKIMLRNSFFEIKSSLFKKYEIGNFFRKDVEAVDPLSLKGNADLSRAYEYGTQNRGLTQYTSIRLMKYINRFSVIRTDRLHIAIAAALLDKKVEFYPNSYFKCRAVYEYSLKDRFPKITWHETMSN